jgi:prophage antirepressor-like protein
MDAFIATTFFRHKRPLRALMIQGQAWFCLQDLGRLMGVPYPERQVLLGRDGEGAVLA